MTSDSHQANYQLKARKGKSNYLQVIKMTKIRMCVREGYQSNGAKIDNMRGGC